MIPSHIMYDGKRVDTEDYVEAKRKALVEFGYTGLTRTTVREQIEHALAGHNMEQGLDVIGMFIRDEIAAVPTTKRDAMTREIER